MAPNENAADAWASWVGQSGSLRTTVGTDGCGERRDQLFNLALRLAGRLGQYFALVVGSQVRREQAQSGQVHLPRADRLQDHRQASCGAGEVDPAIGGVLGKAELADAEGEHRGERPIEVELPLVDLAEMDEKLRFHPSRFVHELSRGGKEVGGAERFDNSS